MKTVLLLISLFLPISAYAQTSPPDELIASANKFSRKLSGGYEVETNRKYVEVRLQASELRYLVFYTMEGHAGTSAYHQWAALLSKNTSSDSNETVFYSDDAYVVSQFSLIGNSGWRSVDYSAATTIANDGEIRLPYKVWKQSDKACCPTGTGAGTLHLSEDEIVFVE